MQQTFDRHRLANIISERLRKSPEVRPFPTVVTQLASACQDPDADSRTFEAIIECDPALSGKILRMANSPLFCPVSQVKSIAHAVSILGLRKLKSVAMSVAGAAMFSSGDRAQKQRLLLWSHSVGCAVVARCMADRIAGVDCEEAFLAGVFHDVGKLLFYDAVPDEYSEMSASLYGLDLLKEEEQLFGTTHEMVGLASAQSWELPNGIRTAIGWHHRPSEAVSCSRLARVTNAANRLARHWGVGSEVVPEDDLLGYVQSKFDLTEAQLESMEEETHRTFGEMMTAAGQ